MPNSAQDRPADSNDDLSRLIARLRQIGGTMLDVALCYARLRIPVFPCHPNNKKPLVQQGFYAATTDPVQLRVWWGKWPAAMIGVPTGKASGFLLIDIDPAPGQSPYDLIAQLRDRLGAPFPAGLMAHTPRGGIHLIYLMPGDTQIGNRTNLLGAGKAEGKIDIRADGGYLIVPPSQRRGAQAEKEGCDGHFYQWDAIEGPGEDFALPEVSRRLIDFITRKNPQETAAAAPSPARRANADLKHHHHRYIQQAFDAEIRMLVNQTKGQRNNALNVASMKLAQLVAAGVLSDDTVRAALEQACNANGLIQDDGIKAVRATIASGFKRGLAQPRDLRNLGNIPSPSRSNPRGATTPPDGPSAPSEDDRAVIRIRPGLLHEAVDEAESILLAAGPGPIYQRSGSLVTVTQRPALRSDSTAEMQEAIAFAEPAFFLRNVAELARCERYAARESRWMSCDPPAKLAEQYYSLPRWNLPALRQLISAPLIRHDGSLLKRHGYDRATCLYLTQELKGLTIPERPTETEAEQANEVLTDLLRGFPWSDPSGRPGQSLAVALAGAIVAVIRAILPTAPAFAVTAPARGSGKSYYVDLVAIIATGARAACVATGSNIEELEKSLFAQLLEGRSVLNLDNMIQPLAGQLLCMVLTQSQVRSRVLGLSKMADASTGSAIFATGNNLAVKGDMVRRTLICSLDPGVEHPENRTFDRDLLNEALARRAELVSAILTIVRWGMQRSKDTIDASQGTADTLPLAGYAEFCRLVRDPLVTLGHPDPVRSIEQGRETDAEDGELEALITAWHACFEEKPKTCREAVSVASAGIYNGINVSALCDAIRAVTHEKDTISPTRLGGYLGRIHGRLCRSMKFVMHGKHRGHRCWKVVIADR